MHIGWIAIERIFLEDDQVCGEAAGEHAQPAIGVGGIGGAGGAGMYRLIERDLLRGSPAFG